MSSRGRVQTKHKANFHVALLCEFDRGIICVYSPQTGRKPTIAYISCKLASNGRHQGCGCLCVCVQFSLGLNSTLTRESDSVCYFPPVCFLSLSSLYVHKEKYISVHFLIPKV